MIYVKTMTNYVWIQYDNVVVDDERHTAHFPSHNASTGDYVRGLTVVLQRNDFDDGLHETKQ